MTDLPGHEALTHSGHDEPVGAVAVLACGALAREILALRAQTGADFTLACLPATLHNAPQKIPDAVRAKIRALKAKGARKVLVGYADCGTGGLLDAVCAEESAERIGGPHCYAFFDGQADFAARAEEEIGAFFLTDFLARQFDALVWRGLGLDRHPDLLPMYFGHYDRLIYLAQTENQALSDAAAAAAARLGLRYERRFTGYGELTDFLKTAAD